MANRNRSAGHNFELEVIKKLKNIGYIDAVSSRSESRNKDNAGIDVCFSEPWAIQCKSMSKIPNYHKLISEMGYDEGEIPVVIHNYTKKAKVNFVSQEEYITMRLSDWLDLVYDLKNTKDLVSSFT